jgi:hypothetical protein
MVLLLHRFVTVGIVIGQEAEDRYRPEADMAVVDQY